MSSQVLASETVASAGRMGMATAKMNSKIVASRKSGSDSSTSVTTDMMWSTLLPRRVA
ncbi:hypothetical protein D3C87_2147820 [compost metagenome]